MISELSRARINNLNQRLEKLRESTTILSAEDWLKLMDFFKEVFELTHRINEDPNIQAGDYAADIESLLKKATDIVEEHEQKLKEYESTPES